MRSLAFAAAYWVMSVFYALACAFAALAPGRGPLAWTLRLPVVPVATNLGLFWPQQDFKKNPGRATVEFLDPIEPGLGRGEFLARLEGAVETRTQELIAQATGEPVRASILVPAPDEVASAAAVQAA